ncbi:hypothetical protein [Nocardioides nanhaiensis]|uniref:Uncharacterized protein n=1 Tax=Nocardioides nanhaiensis TaxID=1476871 RepID=A0ABP8WH57_9ACTN
MSASRPPADERGVRQGLVLWAAVVLALVVTGLGVVGAAGTSGRELVVNLVYLGLGVLTLVWALLARRMVTETHPRAKPVVLGLGGWLVVVALLTASITPLALLLAVTGIVTVFLTLAAEQEV